MSGFTGGAEFAAGPLPFLRRRFCMAPCIGGCLCPPACPVSPECRICGNTATVPPAARPHKLHIPRPAAGGRSRPFRCSSSPNCKRFAGLQFGSIWLVRKSMQKETLDTNRVVPQCHRITPSKNTAASTRKPLCKAELQRRLRGRTLPSGAVATQGDGKTPCCGNNNASTHSPVVQHICILF